MQPNNLGRWASISPNHSHYHHGAIMLRPAEQLTDPGLPESHISRPGTDRPWTAPAATGASYDSRRRRLPGRIGPIRRRRTARQDCRRSSPAGAMIATVWPAPGAVPCASDPPGRRAVSPPPPPPRLRRRRRCRRRRLRLMSSRSAPVVGIDDRLHVLGTELELRHRSGAAVGCYSRG